MTRSARRPVGRHLQSRLPNSRLHIVAGGDHDLARTHAVDVAPLIERHLSANSLSGRRKGFAALAGDEDHEEVSV